MAEPEMKSAIPAPADMLKNADLSTPEKILSMMKDYAAGAIRGVTTDLAGTPVDIMNLLISPATKALGIYSEDPIGGTKDLRKRTGQPLEDSPTEMVGNLLTPGGAAHAMIVGAAKIGKNVSEAAKIKERVTQGALEMGRTIRQAETAGNVAAFSKTGVYWDKGEANAKAVISDAASSIDMRRSSQAYTDDRYLPLATTVERILDKSDISKIYPSVGNIKVYPDNLNPPGSAYYSALYEEIRIASQTSREGLKGTLLHEVQHAIQAKEATSKGTNPSVNRQFTENTLQALVKKSEEIGMQRDWSQMSGQPFSRQAEADALSRWTSKAKLDEFRAFTKYMNNPGEQEARFTQQNTSLSQSELESKVLDLLRQGKSPQSWDTRKLPDSL
jgi:hypothetical protein